MKFGLHVLLVSVLWFTIQACANDVGRDASMGKIHSKPTVPWQLNLESVEYDDGRVELTIKAKSRRDIDGMMFEVSSTGLELQQGEEQWAASLVAGQVKEFVLFYRVTGNRDDVLWKAKSSHNRGGVLMSRFANLSLMDTGKMKPEKKDYIIRNGAQEYRLP